MRLLKSRRGDWIQIFLVMFFVLLLIVAVVLLTLEGKRLEPERPQLTVDLSQQYSDAFLINLLRSDAPIGYESNGQNAPIADIIIIDEPMQGDKGVYDNAVADAVVKALPPGAYFQLTVTYQKSKLLVDNLAVKTKMSDIATLSTNVGKPAVSESHTTLPGKDGNIDVDLAFGNSDFTSSYNKHYGDKSKNIEVKRG